jgi:5-methylcytosine-specific restriction endonuclease McrA
MHNVLILNSQYLPIQTTSVKRAIKLIYRGVAVTEKYSDKVWKSISSEIVLPAVIRLINFHKLPIRTYKLSKKNILIRDKFTCQYCAEILSERSLTIDHIVPKSKGGSSKWENLVAACKRCNTKKADKTPEEAGLWLSKKPTRLSIHTHTTILRNKGESYPEWSEFLFN